MLLEINPSGDEAERGVGIGFSAIFTASGIKSASSRTNA